MPEEALSVPKTPAARLAGADLAAESALDVRLLPVAEIEEDPDQPRKRFLPESIEELARRIEEAAGEKPRPWLHGLLHPILVYRSPAFQVGSGGARWRVFVGARRLRAYRLRGWPAIPARIVESPGNAARALMTQLAENHAREATTLWEDALAVRAAFEAWRVRHPKGRAKDFAAEFGRSAPWVSQHLSVARARDVALAAVSEGHIRRAEAFRLYALLPIEKQRLLLARARREKTPITALAIRAVAPDRFAERSARAALPATLAASEKRQPAGSANASPGAAGALERGTAARSPIEAPESGVPAPGPTGLRPFNSAAPAAPAPGSTSSGQREPRAGESGASSQAGRSLGDGSVTLRLSVPQLRLLARLLGLDPPEEPRALLRLFVRALEERAAQEEAVVA